MGIRPKLFLLFLAFGVIPMLFVSVLNYVYGVRSAEALLRHDVERDAFAISRDIETSLDEREAGLVALARTPSLRNYVLNGKKINAAVGAQNTSAPSSGKEIRPEAATAKTSAESAVPEEVRAEFQAFSLSNPKYYAAVTCLDASGRTLFRAEPDPQLKDEVTLRFQTDDFLSSIAQPDSRVWKTNEQKPLRSPVVRESSGATVRYTIPIFTGEQKPDAPRGALVVDLRLEEVFRKLGRYATLDAGSGERRSLPPRLVVALNQAGQIIYHSNEALKYQSIETATPSFKPVADAMKAGASGWKLYDSPDGTRWLAAYQSNPSLGISVATAANYTEAVGSLRTIGWMSLVLALLVGLVTAFVLTLVVRRTARSIERVTEGAVAIADGNLDQRIEVRSSDETRLLAESFNRMTDRLREQIAREAETRQFESFLRLSAMMTHDLKNAIAALSLLVRNMEHKFHHEEFRVDAMKSLTEATDKLRSLVSKLSEPIRSMSGEHGRPRPTDLVPLIKRVLASTVELSRHHKLETHLPEKLVATIEVDRLEKVVENLVINALEAMGAESGTMVVEAGEAEKGLVYFSVSDTGPGMSEEFQRTRLFRPFATTKKKGVGLGLYTCREVVRAHGGEIEVKSEKGAGACFRVVIPSDLISGSNVRSLRS